ncbi:hypothetical protein SO802_004267 [Lithocarpus litseifolius]|uniref:Glucose-6-phosphate isomerase n=1 Tax=Lithocarpus litseifolius TaxID=425828 RepID=A0AAW2E6E5_9ROSI
MAGKLGAKTLETPFLVATPLFKANPYSAHSLKLSFCKYPFRNRSFSTVLTMAQPDLQNHSPEIKEPSLKIPKLGQNGVAAEISKDPISLLRVKKLSEKAVLPSRGSPLSAGYDLSSATETKVPARGKAFVPTDLSIAIPEGTYARVAPRSGLAWKHSIDVGAGVIDADYRGPVGVILFNHSDVDFKVKVGDRIAQLIIEKIMIPDVIEVEDLDATVRGEGGFGSTGINSTENRSVLHVAFCASRDAVIQSDGKNVVPEVWSVLDKIKDFSERVHRGSWVGASGKVLKDVVAVGISGSFLGPLFVHTALQTAKILLSSPCNLANVDPIDVARNITGLNPETTLVVVVSKTFTAAETMLNARTLREWISAALGPSAVAKHMVAVSTNLTLVEKFGIDPDNAFAFWD